MTDGYILKQAAIDVTREDGKKIPTVAIRIMHDIKAIPVADVVPVVRCKDCENWDTEWKPIIAEGHYCVIIDKVMKPNDFCSYGKLK